MIQIATGAETVIQYLKGGMNYASARMTDRTNATYVSWSQAH